MTDSDPLLSQAEREAFWRSVENVRLAVHRQLSLLSDRSTAVGFVVHLHRGVDNAFQLRVQGGMRPECKPGCAHCCHSKVNALPAEVFGIVRHVVNTLSPADLKSLEARLARQAAAGDQALSWQARPPCAFLQGGQCSIYAIRPAVCRKAHSLDARQCAAGSADIPQDLGLLLDAEALIRGTASAYEQSGLGPAGVELGRAVVLALSDPGLEARWSRGEQVF